MNSLNHPIVEEIVSTIADEESTVVQPAITDPAVHPQVMSNVDMPNGDDWVDDPIIMVQSDNHQSNTRLNNGTTVRQQYRPNQVIVNNNSNNIANNNRNNNENNTRRNNSIYTRGNNSRQYNNRVQLNKEPDRIKRNDVNNRSSHAYMRNNDLIIGSQSGLKNAQNIATNNRQNDSSTKNEIYLGNVVCGTRFNTVKDMLNMMNINFTDLHQLNNRHGYFQSYYFKVPDNKINIVFDPRNWEQG